MDSYICIFTKSLYQEMNENGYYSFSLDKKDSELYWKYIKHLVNQRVQTNNDINFFFDRIAYSVNWKLIPIDIKRYLLPIDILYMLTQYLKKPYFKSIQIHANKDTEEGRKSQPWHRDIYEKVMKKFLI